MKTLEAKRAGLGVSSSRGHEKCAGVYPTRTLIKHL